MNGYARLGYKDKGLFRFMAKVVTGKGAEEFDWQAVAITMNAFAKALTHDPSTKTVFRHFTDQVPVTPPLFAENVAPPEP